jgi:hypothetical protein
VECFGALIRAAGGHHDTVGLDVNLLNASSATKVCAGRYGELRQLRSNMARSTTAAATP